VYFQIRESLQIYKFTKSRNCKLIITNLQLYKLQAHICKYAKSPHYQITKYKIIKLQIACVCFKFQIYKKIASTCLQIYKIITIIKIQ